MLLIGVLGPIQYVFQSILGCLTRIGSMHRLEMGQIGLGLGKAG